MSPTNSSRPTSPTQPTPQRRPASPSTGSNPSSPPSRRPLSVLQRARRKPAALLGPINSLPLPPSPPPSSTKAAAKQNFELWNDNDSIVPLELAKSISLESMKKLQAPAKELFKGPAPLASNSLDEFNLEDEDDE